MVSCWSSMCPSVCSPVGLYIRPSVVHPSVFSFLDDNLSALILLRSDVGLLMGKFH